MGPAATLVPSSGSSLTPAPTAVGSPPTPATPTPASTPAPTSAPIAVGSSPTPAPTSDGADVGSEELSSAVDFHLTTKLMIFVIAQNVALAFTQTIQSS